MAVILTILFITSAAVVMHGLAWFLSRTPKEDRQNDKQG